MKNRFYALSFLPFLSPSIQQRMESSAVLRNDSIATISKTFEYLEQEIQKTEFEKLQSEELIDYDSSAPDGAETIAHEQETQLGQPDWIDDYASDLPSFTVKIEKTAVITATFGGQYRWSSEELDRAAMEPRYRLDASRKQSAIDGMRRWHDTIAAIGSTKHGRTGFVNDANVPLVTPITGTWSTATDDEVIADVQKLLRAVEINSGSNAKATMLAVDRDNSWARLLRPYGANKNWTLKEWLLQNEKELKDIVPWNHLNLADAAGTGPRIVAWRKAKDVVKYNAVYVYKEEAPQKENFMTKVPCRAKTGFTEWRKPLHGAYMDGL